MLSFFVIVFPLFKWNSRALKSLLSDTWSKNLDLRVGGTMKWWMTNMLHNKSQSWHYAQLDTYAKATHALTERDWLVMASLPLGMTGVPTAWVITLTTVSSGRGFSASCLVEIGAVPSEFSSDVVSVASVSLSLPSSKDFDRVKSEISEWIFEKNQQCNQNDLVS